MNGNSAAAKPTPPPPSPSSSMIISLASLSKSKQQPGGISLAEALATSVADYICDKQRMNNGACSALSSATMTTTMAVESNSTRQIRLVGSEEQSNPALADARIHTSADKSKAAETTSSTSSRSVNRSSMSSAVADLASGMCIFGSSSSSGAGSGGDYCQSSNNNNSGSAPIISGTAAAVLALHSASCSNNSNYDNIVSSNSARGSAERKMMIATAASAVTAGREGRCGREGFTPNPSETSVILAGGAQAIADIAPASTASKKMHDHNISNDTSHSPTLSSSSPSKFQMRYSDGAPIIAGTAAAAQMRAIATAVQITCATTKNVDNGGGMMSNCDAGIINPVAILGSRGDDSPILNNFGRIEHDHYHRISVGCGRVGESHQRHGFSSTGGVEAGAAATAATITKQGSNVLSWVDHRSHNTRVTPDSGPSAPEGYPLCHSSAYQVKCLSNTQKDMTSSHPSEPRAVPSITSTLAGGMDILAEITCHAPPMPLSSSVSRTSTAASTAAMTTANKCITYPQQNYGIPSYQEIFHQATSSSSSQEQHSQVHQDLQQDQVPHESVSSENAKRVLAIPSYQEIYREMGLSSQERHHPSQQHHFNFSYSVEEVQVDSHRLSSHQSESFHPHAIHHQHHNLPSSIDDPTKLSKSNQCQANSRSPTAHFGHVNRGDIEEGKELYTRKDLYRFGGHVSEVKDIHGNMKDGCDSLVVGNMVRPKEVFIS